MEKLLLHTVLRKRRSDNVGGKRKSERRKGKLCEYLEEFIPSRKNSKYESKGRVCLVCCIQGTKRDKCG